MWDWLTGLLRSMRKGQRPAQEGFPSGLTAEPPPQAQQPPTLADLSQTPFGFGPLVPPGYNPSESIPPQAEPPRTPIVFPQPNPLQSQAQTSAPVRGSYDEDIRAILDEVRKAIGVTAEPEPTGAKPNPWVQGAATLLASQTRIPELQARTLGAPLKIAQAEQLGPYEARQAAAQSVLKIAPQALNALLDRDAVTARMETQIRLQEMKRLAQTERDRVKTDTDMLAKIADMAGRGQITVPGLMALYLARGYQGDLAQASAEVVYDEITRNPSLQMQIQQAAVDARQAAVDQGNIKQLRDIATGANTKSPQDRLRAMMQLAEAGDGMYANMALSEMVAASQALSPQASATQGLADLRKEQATRYFAESLARVDKIRSDIAAASALTGIRQFNAETLRMAVGQRDDASLRTFLGSVYGDLAVEQRALRKQKLELMDIIAGYRASGQEPDSDVVRLYNEVVTALQGARDPRGFVLVDPQTGEPDLGINGQVEELKRAIDVVLSTPTASGSRELPPGVHGPIRPWGTGPRMPMEGESTKPLTPQPGLKEGIDALGEQLSKKVPDAQFELRAVAGRNMGAVEVRGTPAALKAALETLTRYPDVARVIYDGKAWTPGTKKWNSFSGAAIMEPFLALGNGIVRVEFRKGAQEPKDVWYTDRETGLQVRIKSEPEANPKGKK